MRIYQSDGGYDTNTRIFDTHFIPHAEGSQHPFAGGQGRLDHVWSDGYQIYACLYILSRISKPPCSWGGVLTDPGRGVQGFTNPRFGPDRGGVHPIVGYVYMSDVFPSCNSVAWTLHIFGAARFRFGCVSRKCIFPEGLAKELPKLYKYRNVLIL